MAAPFPRATRPASFATLLTEVTKVGAALFFGAEPAHERGAGGLRQLTGVVVQGNAAASADAPAAGHFFWIKRQGNSDRGSFRVGHKKGAPPRIRSQTNSWLVASRFRFGAPSP